MQADNGVPILSWFEDDRDVELLRLLPILQQLSKLRDVRPFLRHKYQTRGRMAAAAAAMATEED